MESVSSLTPAPPSVSLSSSSVASWSPQNLTTDESRVKKKRRSRSHKKRGSSVRNRNVCEETLLPHNDINSHRRVEKNLSSRLNCNWIVNNFVDNCCLYVIVLGVVLISGVLILIKLGGGHPQSNHPDVVVSGNNYFYGTQKPREDVEKYTIQPQNDQHHIIVDVDTNGGIHKTSTMVYSFYENLNVTADMVLTNPLTVVHPRKEKLAILSVGGVVQSYRFCCSLSVTSRDRGDLAYQFPKMCENGDLTQMFITDNRLYLTFYISSVPEWVLLMSDRKPRHLRFTAECRVIWTITKK